MPDFDISTIPESSLTISGGEQLSGITQGDGSHLVGETITINSNDWSFITVTDNDDFLADNDGNQTLTNSITYDGVAYSAGDRVEAEYELTLEAPDGTQYTVMGFNLVGPGGQPFGSVEGLIFLGDYPPTGVPLQVIAAAEGPSNNETLFETYYSPPCFVTGTQIGTPEGQVAVETIKVGEKIKTLDNGVRTVVWVGAVRYSKLQLQCAPELCPIRFPTGLIVSPHHCILFDGWQAELFCGQDSVLVPAKFFVTSGLADNMKPQDFPNGVTYWHFMFRSHELVFSDGVVSESFFPGPETKKMMPDQVEEIQRLFPQSDLAHGIAKTARYVVKKHEAKAMFSGQTDLKCLESLSP